MFKSHTVIDFFPQYLAVLKAIFIIVVVDNYSQNRTFLQHFTPLSNHMIRREQNVFRLHVNVIVSLFSLSTDCEIEQCNRELSKVRLSRKALLSLR
jgi:hypothetical protein